MVVIFEVRFILIIDYLFFLIKGKLVIKRRKIKKEEERKIRLKVKNKMRIKLKENIFYF